MPKTLKRRNTAKVSKVDTQIKDEDSVNWEQSNRITQSVQHEQSNEVTQSNCTQPVQIAIKKEKDDGLGDVADDSMYKSVSFERSTDFSKCHSLSEIIIVVENF